MFKKSTSKVETNHHKLTFNTVISDDITVIGDIIGEGAIRVDGKVEGNIQLKEGIVLGERGFLKGKITSEIAIIYGKVEGDIECKELQIKDTGFIDGNIIIETFSVETGGKHNGNIKMKSEEIVEEHKPEKKESKNKKQMNAHEPVVE